MSDGCAVYSAGAVANLKATSDVREEVQEATADVRENIQKAGWKVAKAVEDDGDRGRALATAYFIAQIKATNDVELTTIREGNKTRALIAAEQAADLRQRLTVALLAHRGGHGHGHGHRGFDVPIDLDIDVDVESRRRKHCD